MARQMPLIPAFFLAILLLAPAWIRPGPALSAADPPLVYTPSALPCDAPCPSPLVPAWTGPAGDATRALAWGDYDQDGDLDLAVANDGENRLYANDGSALVETWAFGPQNSHSIAWGDYDRDGYLDLAVGNAGETSHVYHNAGDGSFDPVPVWSSSSQNTTSVAWAGWEAGSTYAPHLALGATGGASLLLRYEGGLFVPLTWTIPLTESTYSLAWGDYDRDGDPDLAVGNLGQPNRLYRNGQDPAAPLSLIQSTAEMSATRSVAWGDVDGDGDLDLAVGNHKAPSGPEADQLYCNGGPPDFSLNVCWTSGDRSPTTAIAWGDYDGDGDLDLAATGEAGAPTRIYPNLGGMLQPTALQPLTDTEADGQALAWGDWEGDGDLDLAVGYHDRASILAENLGGSLRVTSISDDEATTQSVAWGDLDGDGWLDLAVGNGGLSANQVFTNSAGTLTWAWDSLEAEGTQSVAWGDFDGDRDLDLAVANGAQDLDRPSRVYVNDGGRLATSWTFGEAFDSQWVAWGDADGDGDLDLAVGNYQANQPNQLWKSGVSQGVPGFLGSVNLEPETDDTRALAWGDFDQDLDLDLAVGNNWGPNRLFVNDGLGNLTDSFSLPGDEDTRSLAWGDWDGDGDLDLAVGNAGPQGFVQILAATPAGDAWSWTPVFTSTESGLDVRSLAWGDCDGDGDLDLAVGAGVEGSHGNLIYANQNGSLRPMWIDSSVPPLTESVAWGDLDRDGDLDLAVGNLNANGTHNRLYVNTRLGTGLPNNPTAVVLQKPGATGDAAFFSTQEILGAPQIEIPYTLFDAEGDRVFRLEPQVSWNGGGRWEPAWSAGGDGLENLTTAPFPTGREHRFVWDAWGQMRDHLGWSIPIPPEAPGEEMDVAFRLVAWSNPEHGGLIQRPVSGSSTTLFRVDLRPNWRDSLKRVDRTTVHPGDAVQYTTVVTQTGHGLPPGGTIVSPLPAGLTLLSPPSATTGDLDWTTDCVTWTGIVTPGQPLILQVPVQVTAPLTDGLTLQACDHLFDGLTEPFSRCTSLIVGAVPDLTGSFQRVNGLPAAYVHPGDPVDLSLVLTNTGSADAPQATATTALPPATLWLDELRASSGLADYADGTVTWRGEVPLSEPAAITYSVQVSPTLAPGTLLHSEPWIDDGTAAPFKLTDTAVLTVVSEYLGASRVVPSADLVELGDTLAYQVLLKNIGLEEADPAILVHPLPPGSVLAPDSLQYSAGTCDDDSSRPSVVCTGTVDVGATVTVTFAVTVGFPGDPLATALTAVGVVTDSLGRAVLLPSAVSLRLPDLSPLSLTASPQAADPGDPIAYTLGMRNQGGRAPQVSFHAAIPPGLTWSGVYDAPVGALEYTASARQLDWTGPALEGGGAVTVTWELIVDAGAAGGERVLSATVDHPCGQLTRQATVWILHRAYLPVVLKGR